MSQHWCPRPLYFPSPLYNISNNSFSVRLREDQSREMKEMRQDIADIKQILTQTFLGQARSLPPATTVPTGLEAQLSRSTSSGKTQSKKSRRHRDKVSSKEQLDRSQEIVSMTTTPLPGVDVRREQSQMVTPGQELETKNSTCWECGGCSVLCCTVIVQALKGVKLSTGSLRFPRGFTAHGSGTVDVSCMREIRDLTISAVIVI